MRDSSPYGPDPNDTGPAINLRKSAAQPSDIGVSLRKTDPSAGLSTAAYASAPYPPITSVGPTPPSWPTLPSQPGSAPGRGRIFGIAAAIVVVVVGGALLVKGFSASPVSNDGSSAKGSNSASRSSGDIAPCSKPPAVSVKSVRQTNGGLSVDTTMTSSCANGDVVTDPSFGIALSDGVNDVAAGVFNAKHDPIVIPANGTTDREFVFPSGTYFRTVELMNTSNLSAIATRSSTSSSSSGSVTDGAETLTAFSETQPTHGTADSAAISALNDLVNSDRPYVTEYLADRWIPQISSKRPGLVWEGINWSPSEILREHLALRQRYENVRLVWSGDWRTFNEPDWWVTIVGDTSTSPDQTLHWCVSERLDVDHCYAKIVSATRGVDGTTVLQKR